MDDNNQIFDDNSLSSAAYLGSEMNRWKTMSSNLKLGDTAFARLLMDTYEKYNALMEIKEPGSFQYSNGFKFSINDTIKPEWTGDGNEVELSREIKVEPHSHYDSELTSDYAEEVEEIIKLQKKKRKKKTRINDKDTHLKKIKVGRPIKLKIKKEFQDQQIKKENKKRAMAKKKDGSEKNKEAESKPWIHINLDNHTDKYTVEKIDSIERQHRRSLVFEFMYSCLICKNFKAENKVVFESHLEKHINNVLSCSTCKYEAYSDFDLLKHKQACSPDNSKLYVCDICGAQYPRRDMYRAHMGKEHGLNHWKCRYCEENFPTRFAYQVHMRHKHSEQLKFCTKCKQYMASLSNEDYHAHCDACTGEFQCPECGKMFQGKMVLATHVRYIHKNIRNHQCHLCSYSAKSANMLRLHLNAHQGIHPFACEQCTFTCVQKYQLKSHMRTHTGEKPYKCDQCNYAAAWNVQLKEHVKAHSLSTAVTCQQCRVMFKNQHTLAIHEKKEHARGAGMAGAEMIGAMVMGAGLTQGQVVPAAAIQQWTLNSSTQ
ncbi:zinc finger protein 37 homolog [Mya arenaria]|uniref:zinc finger protein 37 homolog n=1 Tax=Mya arenaria TaxID=6604 RepID=UPI0022E8BD19|nr:zinc finger protein 37 homolog [Mya arenaria]